MCCPSLRIMTKIMTKIANTPTSPSSTYWWVNGPTWEEYLIGKSTWLIFSSPLLSVLVKSIPQASPSIMCSYNKDLQENLQENNSPSMIQKKIFILGHSCTVI